MLSNQPFDKIHSVNQSLFTGTNAVMSTVTGSAHPALSARTTGVVNRAHGGGSAANTASQNAKFSFGPKIGVQQNRFTATNARVPTQMSEN